MLTTIVVAAKSLSVATAFAQVARPPSPNRDGQMQSVLASDLMSKVKIIGSLGLPLWNLTTIRGTWHDPGKFAKDSSLTLLVTEIGGRRIQPPVEFEVVVPVTDYGSDRHESNGVVWDWSVSRGGVDSPPEPAGGQSWEMVVFETGQVEGLSDEVIREVFGSAQVHNRGFVTELQYLRVRRLESDLRKSEGKKARGTD